MILIGAAMYFLMIRPQRRKLRAQAALQSSIEVGDEVMTTSGVYGFVTCSKATSPGWRSTTTCRSASLAQALQRKVDTSHG